MKPNSVVPAVILGLDPGKAGTQRLIAVIKQPAVYIMASDRNGTLYIGVTSDFIKRVWEQKQGLVDGFTKKHGIHALVYFELHDEMTQAIQREKQLKKWNRDWKKKLIEQQNPYWNDLWMGIV